MNYLYEVLAFEQWLETHCLPISPQLLWYKLMYFCNRSGWSEWVTVDNLRLMATTQMSREATLIKARDELIKAGLIEYQKGKKGSPNRYRMVSLAEKCTFKNVVNSGVQSAVQSAVQNGVQGAVQSADIYKHKQNKIIKPPLPPVERFEEFFSAYPVQARRYLAEKAYCDLVLAGSVEEGQLVEAAGNYAEYVRITGRGPHMPNNFLADRVYEDYLPGRYERPKGRGRGNPFNRIEQNSYDFAELEAEILEN